MILQSRPAPSLLSLVIPCHNEEAMLPRLREEVTKFLSALTIPAEVILVEDGSSDQTLFGLMDWAKDDFAIKILVLSRNFGHQNATIAGLNASHGEAVVLLDADLQDPLAVIHEMISKYNEGYDVVYGRRLSREGETAFKRFSAWFFYRLMKIFIHRGLPRDVGDFRLISRRCLVAVCSMGEIHLFLRGMIAWVGFLQTSVPYRRQPRAAGSTKYTLYKMLRFALYGTFSFTIVPLRISLVVGLVVACTGMGYGFYVAIETLLYHAAVPGWTTQIIFTSVLGGAVLISNGVLGEYVGRSFEQLKARPVYIVAQRINFKEEA